MRKIKAFHFLLLTKSNRQKICIFCLVCSKYKFVTALYVREGENTDSLVKEDSLLREETLGFIGIVECDGVIRRSKEERMVFKKRVSLENKTLSQPQITRCLRCDGIPFTVLSRQFYHTCTPVLLFHHQNHLILTASSLPLTFRDRNPLAYELLR